MISAQPKGAFLPAQLVRPKHAELSAADRRMLHLFLQRLHAAIYRGRADVARSLSDSASRLCGEGSAR